VIILYNIKYYKDVKTGEKYRIITHQDGTIVIDKITIEVNNLESLRREVKYTQVCELVEDSLENIVRSNK
jgi:acyl-ACP thioesterase